MRVDETITVQNIMDGTPLDEAGEDHRIIVGRAGSTAGEAQQLFLKWDIHHLPIVEGDDILVGIVTVRDLMRHYTTDNQDPSETRLEHLMTRNPHVILTSTPVREAVGMLARSKFQALPVVDTERRIIGIVTTRDVVRFLHDNYMGSIAPPPASTDEEIPVELAE